MQIIVEKENEFQSEMLSNLILKEKEQHSSANSDYINLREEEMEEYSNGMIGAIVIKQQRIRGLKYWSERIESYEKSEKLCDEIKRNSEWLYNITGRQAFTRELEHTQLLQKRLKEALPEILQDGVTPQLRALEDKNDSLIKQKQAIREVMKKKQETKRILEEQDVFESMQLIFEDS